MIARRILLALFAVPALVAGVTQVPHHASARVAVATTTTTTTTSTTTTTTTEPTTTTEEPTTTEPPPPPPPPPPKPRARAQAAPSTGTATGAVSSSPGSAAQVVSLANDFRARNGVATLAQAADANAKAQQHADDMAASGSIYHSSSLSSGLDPGWTSVGENVGVGSSASDVESMFEQSSPHRANLLNSGYTQIGAGVAQGADGRIYVCQIFVGR